MSDVNTSIACLFLLFWNCGFANPTKVFFLSFLLRLYTLNILSIHIRLHNTSSKHIVCPVFLFGFICFTVKMKNGWKSCVCRYVLLICIRTSNDSQVLDSLPFEVKSTFQMFISVSSASLSIIFVVNEKCRKVLFSIHQILWQIFGFCSGFFSSFWLFIYSSEQKKKVMKSGHFLSTHLYLH